MLDLDARVHLDEDVLARALALGVEQELDRAGVLVADALREGDRIAGERVARGGVQIRSGRDLHHLLVAALHGAVPLVEVHGRTGAIGQDLHLDVARPQHGLLDEHGRIAEGAVGLAHRALERVAQVLGPLDATHPAPAAAGHGLGEDREADLLRPGDERFDIGRRRGALQHRHAGGDGVLLRRDLVPGHLQRLFARADEGDTGRCRAAASSGFSLRKP